jgi:hypothetical protein
MEKPSPDGKNRSYLSSIVARIWFTFPKIILLIDWFYFNSLELTMIELISRFWLSDVCIHGIGTMRFWK